MEDHECFQRYDSIKGVKVVCTDRLFLLDFDDKNYLELFDEVFGKHGAFGKRAAKAKARQAVKRNQSLVNTFDIAGLYLLINTKKTKNEIYVGESTDLRTRNKGENKKGYPNKMKDFEFDKIILIWDGRPTTTSHFSEDSFRKLLEKYCIRFFKKQGKKYKCRNTVWNPRPTNFQTETKFENFKEHIDRLFKMHGLTDTKN